MVNHTIKYRNGGNKHTRKLRDINCNPAMKNKLKSRPTCMNAKMIKLIRDEYNKSHDDKIVEKKSAKIWDALRDKLKSCNREDCWLQEIEDEKLKETFMESAFAPYHPNEWKKNPSTWLTNYDILNVLTQYEKAYKQFDFIGPTPIDFDEQPQTYNDVCVWKELCKFNLQKMIDKGIKKIGIIFNLDKHTGPGTHWTSLFIDVQDKFIFYFDSAGDSIPSEINKLVEKVIYQGLELNNPIKFQYYDTNNFSHQRGNNECGMYSLFMIITMLTNRVENKIFKNSKEKLDFFIEKRIPDMQVFKKRKIYFNKE
ncbi:MAG: hypothetical protein CBB97_26445 [Candidatus Endolissoclinum sp. TMED37]|nr:MAG: hypothetical protein CBB97_26445 [Candidatus Endolissoclinum sp. TMED37]